MKLRKLIQCCLVCAIGSIVVPVEAQSTMNGLPPLHVDGKFLKDNQGNKVVLHGLMDTPSPFFNEHRWGDYASDATVDNCKNYFNAIFDVITDKEKGANCKLFRLHLDPCWTNGSDGSWPVDERERYNDKGELIN